MQYTHPKVLPFLFLTEMWERFGFYVVQGLLVIYMTEHFGLSDTDTFTISGIFAALVYISPFIGGLLADRVLGFKTAIIWGGIFLIAGYTLIAFSASIPIFMLGLSIIILGNGLFKPNISSLLGTQYAEKNPKRDSGFTLFYVGINIGVALSGLSGYIKASYGYPVTYSLAAMGLFVGMLTFVYGSRYLHNLPATRASNDIKIKLLLGCVLAVAGVYVLLQMHALTAVLLPITGIVLLTLLSVLIYRQDPLNRTRLIVLSALILSSIIFWMLFLQLFNSANLYNDRFVTKNLFGIPLTTTIFWASESIYIFALGPLFAWIWQYLGKRDQNPSPMNKFIIGIVVTGMGFWVLAISTHFPDSVGMINPLWVFGAYLLITIGELFISPVGLSAVTLLSPQQYVGMMMGAWFVATGFGGYFSGMIAKFASVDEAIGISNKLDIYRNAFFSYAIIAFATGILLFIIQQLVKNWIKGDKTLPRQRKKV